MLFFGKYPDCVSGRRSLLVETYTRKNRTHPAGEKPKERAAMNAQTVVREKAKKRREECATAERKASHDRKRTFRFRFPSSPPAASCRSQISGARSAMPNAIP